MTGFLKLTPDAAARIYSGPRYRKRRTPAQLRQVLRREIETLKQGPSVVMQYVGAMAEAILNFKPVR